MKYSFMSFSCPQLTFIELLATAKRFGYDGVEPRIDAEHQHGVETAASAAQRKEIKKLSYTHGIALACIATSCVYADPEITRQNVEYTLKCIDLAADVGAERIRVFGGTLAKGQKHSDAVKIVADALRSVAEHALARGVTVCMETHDSWCRPADVAAVLHRVNHPAVAANWDIMHPVRVHQTPIDEAFNTLKPWIRHLHVHDGKPGSTDLMPIGQGGIDHERAVELLLTIPYQGYLSGEWISWSIPYEEHLPRELATLKSYERAAADAATR
ncbi:MAG: sugar phosphate isomerase/epimerase [Lentisphaerae bacterium]|nr:sugar phosphate isomerase/epimerase [Lentisphaerota bacterium]